MKERGTPQTYTARTRV